MGKTLTSIITIGVAVGINVIPGVGQVISGTLGAALSGTAIGGGVTAFGYAASQVIVGAITLGVTAAGIQSAASLLGLGPSIPKPDTTQTSIRVSRPPRVSAYGINRLYFAYILYETTQNGVTVDVGAVHEGKMSEFMSYYLNDDAITLSGTTVNAGADKRYSGGVVNLYRTDGSVPGTPISAIVSLIPSWTNNHRGDGVVILAQTGKPVKSAKYLETYPNQVPQPSMVAKWQACPDPYSATPWDESTWTWTENPIRQTMHYELVRKCALPLMNAEQPGYIAARDALRQAHFNRYIAPTLAFWKAASDVCNTARPLKAGGTEPLYRSWVSHKHTDRHGEVQGSILATCDGWIAPRSDGALVVYAGKYYEPTVTIGPDEIISYDWSGAGVDDDKASNEIICSYISAEHDYTTVETTAWVDETDIGRRGQLLSSSLDPQVPSWGQVRALAKRKMDRTNQPKRGTITTNPMGRIVRGQRFIWLNLVTAGTTFYSGPAEITALTRNISSGGVTFTWVAANPDIDEWDAATEEGDPAAKGDRIAPTPLAAPVIDSATPTLSDDGSSAQITLDVTGPDREDLIWYAHTRLQGEPTWGANQTYPDTDPGADVTLTTGVVATNAMVEVETAYQIGDGRVSPWSLTETVDTSTANLAPAPVSGFSVTGGTGTAQANWTNPSSPGYTDTRLYRNVTNDFGTATLATTRAAAPGSLDNYTDTITAGTYYYFATARNASGVASAPVAFGPVTVV